MLTAKLKVKNQPDPESRYAPKELRAIDRLVEKEKAGAKKMRPGKQFLAYANKITLVPKAALDQVALSPHGEKLLDEALQDVKKGKTKAFDSTEELIASLKK